MRTAFSACQQLWHVFAVCVKVRVQEVQDASMRGECVQWKGGERGRSADGEKDRRREGQMNSERRRQLDREVVSVYQEHTALAASSVSVVVPSSSLLQHLPERHQAERDPDPSTGSSRVQSPIKSFLLQAQLSSSAPSAPHLSVFTPNHVSSPELRPSGLCLFLLCSLSRSFLYLHPSCASSAQSTLDLQDRLLAYLFSSFFHSKGQVLSTCIHTERYKCHSL